MRNAIWTLTACGALAACTNSNGTGLDAAPHGAYFAVVSDNYSGATTISLLGRDGAVVQEQWVGSKTQNPDLRTPLSDDVVLPTTAFPGYLSTIERGLGVVTRFALDDGSVIGQLRTDDSPEGDMAAYHSNPQDAFFASEKSGWVSRWAPNPDPNAAARERGTDLIDFTPSTMKRGSRRIDLSSLDTMIDEQQYDMAGNPTDKVMSNASARPQALVPAGAFLVVGLVRATDSFSYAEGLTAIVDPVAGKLLGSVTLAGLSNCGDVRPVVGDANEVLVSCLGTFDDPGAEAGIVEIAVDDKGKGKIAQSFKVADHKDAASATGEIVSLGKDVVVAVAPGSLDPATKAVVEVDAAYRIDLKTGEQTQIWKSTGAFSLGIPAFDPTSGTLLLPDAGSQDKPLYGVQRFTVDANLKIEHDTFVAVAPKTTLASREIKHL